LLDIKTTEIALQLCKGCRALELIHTLQLYTVLSICEKLVVLLDNTVDFW
jgi:hypothetical protein